MAKKATEDKVGKSETPLGTLNNCDTSSLDDKGRARLPNRFRSMIGDRIHIFYQGWSGVLRVMSPANYEVFNTWFERSFSDKNPDGMLYKLFQINSAREIVIDSSDRIMIPSELRQAAEIGAGKIYLLSNRGGDFYIYTEAAYKEFIDNPLGFRAKQRADEEQLLEKAVLREQKIQSLMGGLKS
jgi:DNA-binding transcriptional regulator/RsmH inhibitor MraZ